MEGDHGLCSLRNDICRAHDGPWLFSLRHDGSQIPGLHCQNATASQGRHPQANPRMGPRISLLLTVLLTPLVINASGTNSGYLWNISVIDLWRSAGGTATLQPCTRIECIDCFHRLCTSNHFYCLPHISSCCSSANGARYIRRQLSSNRPETCHICRLSKIFNHQYCISTSLNSTSS
jgi:hypothetical protein